MLSFLIVLETRKPISKIEETMYTVQVHGHNNNIYGYFRYDFYIHTLSISLFGFASIQFDIDVEYNIMYWASSKGCTSSHRLPT